MQKVLFLGHTYHLKTKSSVFLLDLLKGQYDVTEFYMDPDQAYEYSGFEQYSDTSFDILVVWQIMPDISELRKLLTWKHSIFFPMFDHYVAIKGLSADIWRQYQDFIIVCFSKTMQQELAENGFDTRYIQYFPAPAEIKEWGDEQSLFFWQRLSFLNLGTLAKAAKNLLIGKLHLHLAPDPGHEIQPRSSFDDETTAFLKGVTIKESTWFDKKSDLIGKIEESAFYMAPRHYEGIGMSFLEAMAMGRCVIAPDTATMNEYITDGVNGLLYPWLPDTPTHCGAAIRKPEVNIRQIQMNTYRFITEGHIKWNAEKKVILKWLEEDACPDSAKLDRCAYRHGWKKCPMTALPPETLKAIRYYKPEIKYTLKCLLLGRFQQARHFLLIHFNSRFMRTWYLLMNPDVVSSGLPAAAHYLNIGWKEGLDPSPRFSTTAYLQKNPDVKELEMCPLLHWKLIGKKEKRSL